MSAFSAVANHSRQGQTGKYIHAENVDHKIVAASIVLLIVSAAFAWLTHRACGSSCGTGEYLLIFSPAVGIMLLVYACMRIYLRKRLGDLLLQLPQPLHPGCSDVPATLYFIAGLGQGMRRTVEAYPLALEVVCTHEDRSGENSSTNILWSKKFKDRYIAHGTGVVDFTLRLPADLPVSGNLGRSEIKIIWKLQVRVLGAKVSFILPVRPVQAANL
ncbi:hypothetical protein ACO0LG_16905 [Undibacterium sp. Ji42W]|uniref:hypothetical protein n=1 Tax=Undibacterium sp. Ji42W TaxID=3413039 RepID=UPI003BF41962